MTQFGTCALCCEPNKILQDSHLIPRAVYEVCRTPDLKNPSPVIVTKKVVLQAPHQISDYLLCKNCENRFNSRGESWILARLPRDGVSPLYGALSKLQSVGSYGEDRLYVTAGCPDIDTQKLVYFAMSVYWRASVQRWKHLGGEVGIQLGKYEEPLRKWLMDEDSFPRNMAIVVCIPPSPQALAMTYGPRAMQNSRFHVFTLYVPGVEFILFVGNRLPEDAVVACAQNTAEKFVFSSPDVVKKAKEAFWNLRRESHVSRKLQESLERFRASKRGNKVRHFPPLTVFRNGLSGAQQRLDRKEIVHR